jgi:hypothetical protein
VIVSGRAKDIPSSKLTRSAVEAVEEAIHRFPPSGLERSTERERERGVRETEIEAERERDEPEYSVFLVDRDETSGQEEVHVDHDDQKAKEPKDFWAVFLIQQLHRVSIRRVQDRERQREVERVILTRHPLENSSQRPQQRKSKEGRRWR